MGWLRITWVVVAATVLSACATSAPARHAPSKIEVIENYFAVLNRRDLLSLTAYVAPDVEWLSIVDGERILEVSGREALAEQLRRYFAQSSETRWSVDSVLEQGRFVVIRERSSWRDAKGSGARITLCVYELNDGRIRRIVQFLSAD